VADNIFSLRGFLSWRLAGRRRPPRSPAECLPIQLVSNVKLQDEAPGQQIEVHAGRERLDESNGLPAAHEHARIIGQRLNAKLVIWGRKISEKKFYSQITVVAAPRNWSAATERTHDAQIIKDLQLPPEVVGEPFYLIHFAAGYSYCNEKRFREALPHFEAALLGNVGSRDELADLQFFTALCNESLAAGQKKMDANLQEAIGLYEKAAKIYEAVDQRKWAATQNNLGATYADLPTGERPDNLQKAIAAFEAALRVRTEKDFPADWASTQTNLGTAYYYLPTGERADNLQKGKVCFKAALRVYTESSFPENHRNVVAKIAEMERELRNLASE